MARVWAMGGYEREGGSGERINEIVGGAAEQLRERGGLYIWQSGEEGANSFV